MKYIYKNEENVDDLYRQLLGAARHVALQIVEAPPARMTGAAEYIYRVSLELIAAVSPIHEWSDLRDMAVLSCIHRLVDVWPRLSRGEIDGEEALAGDLMLWKRAMTEWPMGGFAKMSATFLIENHLLGGNVLELGAGVGSCGTLVAGHVGNGYIRTDIQPYLLKRQKMVGSVSQYDFNSPGVWRNIDTIFAVNALHCAKDKHTTLTYVREMLRPGGVVVLGEGMPYTNVRGAPWPLNGFLGLFRGWWDVGGFVSRDTWLANIEKAGFVNAGFARWLVGEHDLGGVIWAER